VPTEQPAVADFLGCGVARNLREAEDWTFCPRNGHLNKPRFYHRSTEKFSKSRSPPPRSFGQCIILVRRLTTGYYIAHDCPGPGEGVRHFVVFLIH